MIELILGGARSGKSRLAEQRALASGKQLYYLATAQAGDQEMAARIAHHQQRRDQHWQLIEEPRALADTLAAYCAPERCILVDCLTLWMSNLLHSQTPQHWDREKQKLLDLVAELPGDIILVSNEVGMGIVPLGELSRRFVDESGWLHQALAERVERVTLVVAGLPLSLK